MTNRLMRAIRRVGTAETQLMRQLTDEEACTVMWSGIDQLREDLDLTEQEFDLMQKIRKIISAYCLKDKETYLDELKDNSQAAIDVLESIVKDYYTKLDHYTALDPVENPGDCDPDLVPENGANKDYLVLRLAEILTEAHLDKDWVKNWAEHCSNEKVLEIIEQETLPEDKDETPKKVIDQIKSDVLESLVNDLKEGMRVTFFDDEEEIIESVMTKLMEDYDHVSVKLVNNVMSASFK